MEFVMLVLEDEGAHAREAPSDVAALIEARARFAEELAREGKLRDAGRLRPSKEGRRVRRDGVESGPFAEGGKSLGAYYWVRADGVEEAAKLAARCPALATDAIDVRALRKGDVQAGKDDKPGKIFALAVLGNRPSEDEWVKLMDRIDAETHTSFPDDSFLGGFRLEPPKRGRRVERHATFDGPFLEGKEVIGGAFFLRMASLEEAVAWTRETRFVVHGALEIRELWRTWRRSSKTPCAASAGASSAACCGSAGASTPPRKRSKKPCSRRCRRGRSRRRATQGRG